MPKYLIDATAFKETEPGKFSPHSFSFEVTMLVNWNAKNSEPVRQLAYRQCELAFGFLPKQFPQIDRVVKIDSKATLPEEMLPRLGLIGSMTAKEKDDLLRDIVLLATEEPTVAEAPAAEPDFDDEDLI